MRPFFRAAFALAAALCVWLAASPAKAAAPLCDSRGAIAFAPTPHLQAPSPSVQMSTAVEACFEHHFTGDAIEQGRGESPLPSWSMDASAPPSREPVLHAPGFHVSEPAPLVCGAPPSGVSPRVDRPPRG
jgi:hypothetical protein